MLRLSGGSGNSSQRGHTSSAAEIALKPTGTSVDTSISEVLCGARAQVEWKDRPSNLRGGIHSHDMDIITKDLSIQGLRVKHPIIKDNTSGFEYHDLNQAIAPHSFSLSCRHSIRELGLGEIECYCENDIDVFISGYVIFLNIDMEICAVPSGVLLSTEWMIITTFAEDLVMGKVESCWTAWRGLEVVVLKEHVRYKWNSL
ncbi:hypothetical protein EJ05DRAFT_484500 [Pseudovirgaria hyperparasitica]|uniref:Uncharacterized protein n=1 Tax=Pseudovirgaria hyperparasitica TaxID=470096 RepID=A0A6A6WAF9_9PEZI|nr:uncharacterized protein EJ05DRAFT_484500 [Pseudovirgaria hyperparasitica]KAF2759555.1 hypothetical protein EJ05DRAFT_484500 [Pseudovirgaria hyperparasitica]